MKRQKTPFGYTVIEVMIVLAVSGVMFVIAANFINGKQQKTAFTQGVNEMASRLQNTINEVNDGKYTAVNLSCGATINETGGATETQGTNQACVFLGKIFHFKSDTHPEYEVISIAGNRLKSPGVPATNLPDTNPRQIAPLTRDDTTPQNLDVISVKVNDNILTYGFGFVQGLGSFGGGAYASGSQTVSMVFGDGDTGDIGSYGGLLNGSNIKTASSAVVCMTDGTRYATLNIGNDLSNGNQLSVRTKMLGTTACT